MVINEVKIEKDLEIREIFSCRDESKFQEEFISYFENEELNKENFSKFQQKFRKRIHLIQDIKYDDYITLQKMIDFISDPSTKKTIIREKTKNWEKILKKINTEFKLNNINWWKHYNQIRGNNPKMIKNNPKMEREYKEHIDTIKKKINKKFLKEIENTKSFYETEKEPLKPLNFFEKEEIEEQLKIFQTWIKNPNKDNLNFIKERDLLFIHKKGDEGVTLNYRPISINNALARIFLKLVYKKIEQSWDHIDPLQFGFRKKFDTRIAVKNFLDKFNEEKTKRKRNHTWAVTIDLAKCFDSVPHKLIVKTAPKFIKDPLIREFIKQYYNGNGTGVYQGDPLSPIIFAYISHFILQRIKPHTLHTQMYADDLILIMEGKSLLEIEKLLKTNIYPIITKYGLTVNDDKTEKETGKNLKKIKYLGIWLNKKEHIQRNLDTVSSTFKTQTFNEI
ncbi:nuclear intron maturase 1 [Anaeramoeba flamelloides]|uniref:Nuclear intron maturase 1 n=1 Tax=Anaeramoeba flamelloides TaxID=1746091 RepID=A0ABQ8YAD8_9EUKA|nr:nuclear intron maturase 1 [Anaeramoeba flamelloides]